MSATPSPAMIAATTGLVPNLFNPEKFEAGNKSTKRFNDQERYQQEWHGDEKEHRRDRCLEHRVATVSEANPRVTGDCKWNKFFHEANVAG
ncbi:hypothetical protein [Agrobacterium pusense]|uniref:hypothetical protein n=1 Tax=Agrobacterium pusense TaxID=648995 RepID=UPI00244CCF1C|nr:hypothetical protein [Agrobacterium pusense]MDH0873307.1 hypothetical protein [Agrobacterium pusense]MDH1267551.1 hypothetical protein [Agrobacterium pusense]